MNVTLSFKYKYKEWVLLILFAFMFSACAPGTNDNHRTKRPEIPEVVDIEAILKQKNLPEKKKAEKLSLSGEKLVSPIGFMYANEVFAKVLEIDPGNKKALFYKAILNPLMKFKGILKRIEPLINKGTEKDQKRYKAEITGLANGGLREFLLDGKPDIDSEVKLQKFVASTRASQNKLRLFLKSNKELILNLKINLFEQGITKHCSVVKTQEGLYKQSTCDFISVQERKVDRADIEILQHIVAGLQVYSILLTAYDGTGIQEINNERQSRKVTEEEMVNHLMSVSQFGKLQKDNSLSEIPKLGSDIFSGAKWAYRMQKFLCPLGRSGGQMNRPGYLMNRGVCISNSTPYGTPTEQVFEMLEIALQGMPQTYDFRDNQGKESQVIASANFNPLAPIFNPKSNLKELMPNQFDDCGRTTGFSDKTIGGMFPDSDANNVVQTYRALWDADKSAEDKCK